MPGFTGSWPSGPDRTFRCEGKSQATASPRLAATYSFGIARNHPFVDGKKRAAFLSVGLFLALNGYRLVATQADTTVVMLALAAGELDEAAFAGWLRAHSEAR